MSPLVQKLGVTCPSMKLGSWLYHSLNKLSSTEWDYCLGKAALCPLQPISFVLNPAMRGLNTNELVTSKVTTIYVTQKILQLKDIYNLEVSKFMYKFANSQLPVTFNKYSKLITDVHPYSTKPIKTRQFASPKARSNSGAKMIKYSAIYTWSRIPLEIKK